MRKEGLKYIKGDPWTMCDICGWKVRKSQTKMTWDGSQACLKDWESKHPQLYPTPKIAGEGFPYPNSRPEGEDQFLADPSDNAPEI